MIKATVPEDQMMTTEDEKSNTKEPVPQQEQHAFGQKDVWVDSDSDDDGEKEEERARKVAR